VADPLLRFLARRARRVVVEPEEEILSYLEEELAWPVEAPLGPCLFGYPESGEWDEEAWEASPRKLFSKRNDKLGYMSNFSIPAFMWEPLELKTCPGATPWCEKWCYAMRGRFQWGRVLSKHAWNLEQTLRPDFADRAIEELRRKWPGMPVRIHVAGDFYSAEYVEKWIDIVDALQHLVFYTYTRSWRVPEIRAVLEKLMQYPNIIIYASTDPDTGPPPEGWLEAGIDRTYLAPSVQCFNSRDRRIKCRWCMYCAEGRGHVWFPKEV